MKYELHGTNVFLKYIFIKKNEHVKNFLKDRFILVFFDLSFFSTYYFFQISVFVQKRFQAIYFNYKSIFIDYKLCELIFFNFDFFKLSTIYLILAILI